MCGTDRQEYLLFDFSLTRNGLLIKIFCENLGSDCSIITACETTQKRYIKKKSEVAEDDWGEREKKKKDSLIWVPGHSFRSAAVL